MKQTSLFLCLACVIPTLAHGQDRDQRIADLERQFMEAKGSVAALQKTIESLATEVKALRPASTPVSKETSGAQTDAAKEFAARIIGPDNGSGWRQNRRSSFKRDIRLLPLRARARLSNPTFGSAA